MASDVEVRCLPRGSPVLWHHHLRGCHLQIQASGLGQCCKSLVYSGVAEASQGRIAFQGEVEASGWCWILYIWARGLVLNSVYMRMMGLQVWVMLIEQISVSNVGSSGAHMAKECVMSPSSAGIPSAMRIDSWYIDGLIVETFCKWQLYNQEKSPIETMEGSLDHQPASQTGLIWLHWEGHSAWNIIETWYQKGTTLSITSIASI